ncbi:MAG: hypothetical protein PSX80_16760 [bacterium]|nr:hypothetical protein [bacterium]
MKNFILRLSFIAFVFVLGGIAVNAQGFGRNFDANIPFDFSIGGKTLPAGKYIISLSGDANGPGYLEVRNERREVVYSGLALTNGERLTDSAELRFAQVAGRAELAMIVSERSGHSINASRRNDLVAASKKSKNEKVNN